MRLLSDTADTFTAKLGKHSLKSRGSRTLHDVVTFSTSFKFMRLNRQTYLLTYLVHGAETFLRS